MITEDYVSFETAKLLREKGFNEQCYAYYNIFYDNDGKVLKLWRKYPHRAQPNSDYLNVPTLQMAIKWLRNTFHLEIYSFHDAIQESNDWWYRIEYHSKGCSLTKKSDAIYKTYEQACEAAIKYCLENLI